MARDDLEEWDPKTGTSKPAKINPVRPGGSPNRDTPAIPISPGGYMKGKSTPQYQKGGSVRDIPSESERMGEIDRVTKQRESSDPLTSAVNKQPGQIKGRAPAFEFVPKGNTSLEAVNRAERAEIANHERRLEDIPHFNRGGSVKHGSSTRVACASKNR
jgi:hypothetical protein